MIDPIHIHYTVLMRWTQWAPSLLRLPSCMNGIPLLLRLLSCMNGPLHCSGCSLA